MADAGLKFSLKYGKTRNMDRTTTIDASSSLRCFQTETVESSEGVGVESSLSILSSVTGDR